MRLPSKKYCLLFLFTSVMCCVLLSSRTPNREVAQASKQYFALQLDSLQQQLLRFEQQVPHEDVVVLQASFEKSRYYFKKLEGILSYHFPASAQKMNGAALPESEPSEPNETVLPMGFQVLEEIVYGEMGAGSRDALIFELSNLLHTTNKIKHLQAQMLLSEGNILDAIRLNLYRLLILGITGFDRPVALKSIQEAVYTLQGTRDLLQFFPESDQVQAACDQAIHYIQNEGYDFNGFDRATFITGYLNPLCIALYDYQQAKQIAMIRQNKALSSQVKHIFENGAFDVLYFAPEGTPALSNDQIALGRKLFHDARLSSGKRSCATCHQPDKAFTDGKRVHTSLFLGKTLSRNTPTLINAALQPVQFYDSRIAFLEDQAHDVITNEAEMGGQFDQIVALLRKDNQYKSLFKAAYGEKQVTRPGIKKALAAYVRSLTALNSPFDQYMRGNANAMTGAQVRGFNLFAGKAKCATCHFIPLFSGVVPPSFQKMESEVLGLPINTDTLHPLPDTDSGKFLLYQIPHQLYAFKTTSIRNAALTAPYMHHGVFNTLEEVIDFYEKGGGAGLGFDLPNQTLPPDRLGLSVEEKKDLIAFIQATTDTAVAR